MLPHVVIHNAISVDGRTDWFNADVDKFYELTSTWVEDATLAGSDTLLAAYKGTSELAMNEEQIQEKDPEDARPLLVVPDSKGRLRIWNLLRKEQNWRDVLALCSKSTPQEYLDYLGNNHVEYLVTGEENVDYKIALEEINSRYNINFIRVDSGGTLNGILLRQGLVNEVSILMHPCLVGGTSPRSMFQAPDLDFAGGVIELKLSGVQKLDGDLIWLRYEVIKQ